MYYRRADVKGGTYFFTVNLAERQKTLLVDEINILRNVIKKVKQQHPFKIDAIVVLPDHIHTIWTLPTGDNHYSKRWMLIKSGFSRHLPKIERINKSRAQKGERGIWQRRYWEHLIRDEPDYKTHVDYIHYNPVKHGYVKRAVDWPYSSINALVEKGIVDSCWGYDEEIAHEGIFGEMV